MDGREVIERWKQYKVLSQIIFRRLSPKTNEFVGSYQTGFIEGRSTTDQIFTVRQILQKCREYLVPTHHLFIDFKTVYDNTDRAELRRIMDENAFSGKLTRLIKARMDGVQNCVRVSGELSSSFESFFYCEFSLFHWLIGRCYATKIVISRVIPENYCWARCKHVQR